MRGASLGGRLVLWILLVHVVAALGVTWYSYRSIGRIIAGSKDDQLETLAESYAAAANVGAGARPISRKAARSGGGHVVQYFGADGKLLASSYSEADIPLQGQVGLATATTRDGRDPMAWRIYTAHGSGASSDLRVQVSQSIDYQNELVTLRALNAEGRSRSCCRSPWVCCCW